LPDFLHLPLDGHHFSSKKEIPSKENTGVYTGSEEFAPHMACLIMLFQQNWVRQRYPFPPSLCFCDDQFALSGPHFWIHSFLVHCWQLSLLFIILINQALSPHWSAEPFTHISLKFAIQFFFIADNQADKFELLVSINVKLGYCEWSRSFRRIYMNCGPCQLSS
jgi:hypothetical protein